MSVQQKEYDYANVQSFCNSGGPLDTALSKLQSDLAKLRVKINECEPLYHGVGTTSPVYQKYQDLYNKIGTDQTSGSMWFNAAITRDLINFMYTNAETDYNSDQM